MKYTIRHAENGWICEASTDEDTFEVVGVESEDEVEAFRDFLRSILNNYGPSSSRYSEKRIRIITLPGDKWEGKLSDSMREELTDLKETCESYLSED